MKHLLILFLFVFAFSCTEANPPQPTGSQSSFSFAFFTDIHLNNGNNNCWEGLDKAINDAKSEGADFIMTGGDNVDIDGLRKDAETAHELYQKYALKIENAGIPFYPTIGNHDRFWGVEKNDPLYNEGMFEKYIHETTYSFDHKGWHFIVLNTTQIYGDSYCVNEEQKQWLAADLAKVDKQTPIVISVHVPFLSVYYPALRGEYTSTDTFSNFKEIWDMFENKNLKLVLQGHMHLYEEIKVRGIQFITAGAVSASWWGGSYHGTEEGYLKVDIDRNNFDWEYVDYGWEVN
jgi:UDP-2,3-diacylglucosamine pyrophosphatase LpxH